MANPQSFVTIFSLLFCFLYFVHSCFSFHIINYEEETKKIFDALEISNPTATDKKFAQEILNERAKTAWEQYDHNRTKEELNKERQDVAAKNTELGELRSQKNSETVKVKIRDVAIGYRSRIEKLENLLFPPWLLSTKLTREQRFFIASTIYTTKYSGVLHDRLVNETLSPSDYAMALQEIYGDLSNRFEHFQKTHRVPETDEEWKALFEYLELVDEYQKKAMKVSLPGLPVPPKKLSIGENRYFVLVDNVDFKVTKQDVEMLFSSAVDPQGKTNICMIKKFKGLPSGFVAVDFVTKLSKTIEELEDNLESYKQPPFDKKKVNARVYIEP